MADMMVEQTADSMVGLKAVAMVGMTVALMVKTKDASSAGVSGKKMVD